MKRLQKIIDAHKINLSLAEPDSYLPGIFCDCHKTLFEPTGQIRPLMAAFLRMAHDKWDMQIHIASSDILQYSEQIKSSGLEEICTSQVDKLALQSKIFGQNKVLEFMIDDEPIWGDSLSFLHPEKLMPILEDIKDLELKPYIKATPSVPFKPRRFGFL